MLKIDICHCNSFSNPCSQTSPNSLEQTSTYKLTGYFNTHLLWPFLTFPPKKACQERSFLFVLFRFHFFIFLGEYLIKIDHFIICHVFYYWHSINSERTNKLHLFRLKIIGFATGNVEPCVYKQLFALPRPNALLRFTISGMWFFIVKVTPHMSSKSLRCITDVKHNKTKPNNKLNLYQKYVKRGCCDPPGFKIETIQTKEADRTLLLKQLRV